MTASACPALSLIKTSLNTACTPLLVGSGRLEEVAVRGRCEKIRVCTEPPFR